MMLIDAAATSLPEARPYQFAELRDAVLAWLDDHRRARDAMLVVRITDGGRFCTTTHLERLTAELREPEPVAAPRSLDVPEGIEP
jgi:recombinational DNA repair ATPase RecF